MRFVKNQSFQDKKDTYGVDDDDMYEPEPVSRFGNAPIHNSQSDMNSSAIEFINPSDLLTTAEMNFRGYYFNTIKGQWDSFGRPLMNEEGIMRIVTFLALHINAFTAMTKFDKRHANALMLDASESLRQLLALNSEDFGIQPKDFNMLTNNCMHLLNINLHMAVEGHITQHLTSTSHRVESIQESNSREHRGGFLSKFNPLKR